MIPTKSHYTIRRAVCPRCHSNRAAEQTYEMTAESLYRRTIILCKCSDPRSDDDVWKEYCDHMVETSEVDLCLDYSAFYKALMEDGEWTESVEDDDVELMTQ